MWFPEVDEAVGGLWDGSKGSDGGVADPDRWNTAFVLNLLIIIIIPQINDISNTTQIQAGIR